MAPPYSELWTSRGDFRPQQPEIGVGRSRVRCESRPRRSRGARRSSDCAAGLSGGIWTQHDLHVCRRIAGACGHANGSEVAIRPRPRFGTRRLCLRRRLLLCRRISPSRLHLRRGKRRRRSERSWPSISAGSRAPAPGKPASKPATAAKATLVLQPDDGPLGGRRPVARAGRRERHDLAAVCAPVLPRAYDRRLGARGRARGRASAGLTETPPRCRAASGSSCSSLPLRLTPPPGSSSCSTSSLSDEPRHTSTPCCWQPWCSPSRLLRGRLLT